MSLTTAGKRRQSQHRNADTQFMNELYRSNEQARAARSQAIREREHRARCVQHIDPRRGGSR